MKFNEKLKTARIRCGITQKQISKMLNVSVSTYSAWECGRAKPNVVNFANICLILNADASYLLGIENDIK